MSKKVLKWEDPDIKVLDIITPEFESIHYHSMKKVSDTEIFIFGGKESSGCVKELRIFDVSAGKIFCPEQQKNKDVLMNVSGHATFYHKGRFYSFGGEQKDLEGYVNDVFSIDVKTLEWKTHEVGGTWEIPSPREGHTMCLLPGSDTVMMFGGANANKYSNVTFLLDLKTMVWARLHPRGLKKEYIPSPRFYHCMEEINGIVHVFGGWVEKRESKKLDPGKFIYRFDPKIKKWIEPVVVPDDFFPDGQASAKSAKYKDWLIIFGGYKKHCIDDIHRITAYNPTTGDWKFGKDIQIEGETYKKLEHPAIEVIDDSLYVVGGNYVNDVKNHNVHKLTLDF